MAYIQSYKGQSWLLPPSIEDLIPDDHICFLVEEVVNWRQRISQIKTAMSIIHGSKAFNRANDK